MKKLSFQLSCIEGCGDSINEMKANSTSIVRSTFLKHVDREQMKQLQVQLGYELNAMLGLTMASDFLVGYYKSTYQGKPCYYFAYSGIEYIFM